MNKKIIKVFLVSAMVMTMALIFTSCTRQAGEKRAQPEETATEGAMETPAETPMDAEKEVYLKAAVLEMESPPEGVVALKEAIENNKPVVINYSSSTCGACEALKPTYEEVKNEFGDRVVFVEYDINQNELRQVAQSQNVRATPTLHFINSNGELSAEIIGVQPREAIVDQVEVIVPAE
ncbi:MAG: thioredoxin family protein [Vulcanimicrobiota bacterium]